MPGASKRSFNTPDERIDLPGITAEAIEIGDTTVSRSVFQPGTHCSRISYDGLPTCDAHHSGYAVDGMLHVEMLDGSVLDVGPNEVFDIPPGHDGWAVGDRPFVALGWAGYRTWLAERDGERVLLTLLVTDIVDSTKRALELGDATWRDMLARHYQDVRSILDRYRGRQIKTTGDGILASFDGAGRAIRAALAIRDKAEQTGLEIRAGVHSGEVQVGTDDVTGVTVHEAARIAASAVGGEVLVSETTHLLAGAGDDRLSFEDRGGFDLKGLGRRQLYSVSG